jgi:hypothetical protein
VLYYLYASCIEFHHVMYTFKQQVGYRILTFLQYDISKHAFSSSQCVEYIKFQRPHIFPSCSLHVCTSKARSVYQTDLISFNVGYVSNKRYKCAYKNYPNHNFLCISHFAVFSRCLFRYPARSWFTGKWKYCPRVVVFVPVVFI